MNITTRICLLLIMAASTFSTQARMFGQTITNVGSAAGNVFGRDPAARLACQQGAPRCVDLVIREMTRRWRRLDRACDHRAPFALLYLRTTEEFRRSLDYVAYDDPAAVIREDAYFAQLYFNALDDPANAPGAWRVAEEAASAGTQTVAGDLILGVNAHIQRDLAFTLYGLYRLGRPVSYEDHTRVNEFLRRVDVTAEIRERYDPTYGTGPDGGGTGVELIIAWREVAYRNYERLRDAGTEAERGAVAAEIEAYATAFAQSLQAATLAADGGAARDSYCEDRGK